jgi:hypothetical protein
MSQLYSYQYIVAICGTEKDCIGWAAEKGSGDGQNYRPPADATAR